MRKKLLWISTSLATTVLATAASGILLSNKLMYIKLKDPQDVLLREKNAKRYDEKWYDTCHKQPIEVLSPNGYAVKGVFMQPLTTPNTVIICHGVTENKMNSIRYVRMFERLGFNSVIYDHRRHGDSGGKTTSFGHYEKYDLQAMIAEVRHLVGEEALIGVHGESMGAATTLLYAGTLEDDADFYISDCAFSDFPQLLRKIVKDALTFDLPQAVPLTNLFVRLRDGYSVHHVSPKEAVSQITKPVLFMHSVPDRFIPSTMAEELFAAKATHKKLVLFEDGEHAQSFNEAPELYELQVSEFLYEFVPHYTPFGKEEPAS